MALMAVALWRGDSSWRLCQCMALRAVREHVAALLWRLCAIMPAVLFYAWHATHRGRKKATCIESRHEIVCVMLETTNARHARTRGDNWCGNKWPAQKLLKPAIGARRCLRGRAAAA